MNTSSTQQCKPYRASPFYRYTSRTTNDVGGRQTAIIVLFNHVALANGYLKPPKRKKKKKKSQKEKASSC